MKIHLYILITLLAFTSACSLLSEGQQLSEEQLLQKTSMKDNMAQFDHNHPAFNMLLKTHVTESGLVDYKAIKASPSELNNYLDLLSKVSENTFNTFSENQRLSFFINLYNASTIKLIIDHYPVKRIKDIGGLIGSPWDIKSVNLHGKQISLNNLEHDIVRKRFEEPRIHFALVCAAIGCPILKNEAFISSKLNEQLEEQTKAFLSDKEKNSYSSSNKTLHISPIFKWYREDFEKNGSHLVTYLTPYYSTLAGMNHRDVRVKFTDYDWSLNEQS